MRSISTIFLLLLCIPATRSFGPSPSSRQLPWGVMNRAMTTSRRTTTRRAAFTSDNSNNDDGGGLLELPNSFEMFLTQCSIQSFMFLARSMRDPQTVMWVEDFTRPAIVQKDTGCDLVTVLADAREEQQVKQDDDDDDDDEKDKDESLTEALMNRNDIHDDEDDGKSVALESMDGNDNDPENVRDIEKPGSVADVPSRNDGVPSFLYFASITETTINEIEKDNSETDIPFYASLVEPSTNRGTGVDADNDDQDQPADPSIHKDDDETSTDEDDECSTEPEERKFSKLLQYHGLAALNTTIFPTWDVYFEKLLKEPTVHYIVESDSPYVPEYELEIDPSSLCSRIVSVREQIAKEFVTDLNVIAHMGGSALESYWDTLKARKEGNETDSPLFQRESLLFLELSPENSVHGPSPLRKGNFDLLLLLTTQASVHRVLNDESRQSGPERVTNEFLRQFYMERAHYFRGPQRYGRADDFLEELLESSPKLITVSEGVTSLIDPTRIAELIVQAREKVALEWKEIAEESPRDHMSIQRMRLNRMMGTTTTENAEESFQ